MAYSLVSDVAQIILQIGPGTKMATIDIASAFRFITVHPNDWYLLGIKWNDQLYIYRQLPFSLQSTPLLFNGYADALEWIFGCWVRITFYTIWMVSLYWDLFIQGCVWQHWMS